MGECLAAICSWVPHGDEPETMTWNDPFEARHKERAEKLAVEQEFSPEAHRGFLELREKGLWPDTSGQACWVMNRRVEWAIHLTSLLASLQATAGCGELTPAKKNPFDVCEWLAFEVYDSKISFPRKWWDGSSFEDYYDY